MIREAGRHRLCHPDEPDLYQSCLRYEVVNAGEGMARGIRRSDNPAWPRVSGENGRNRVGNPSKEPIPRRPPITILPRPKRTIPYRTPNQTRTHSFTNPSNSSTLVTSTTLPSTLPLSFSLSFMNSSSRSCRRPVIITDAEEELRIFWARS